MFNYIKQNLALLIFGLVIGFAGFIRFFVAPLSTGPDVSQFWAFAEVFRQHGIDFYRYAGATQDVFPYKGWAYAYPPIWLLFLGLALLCAPHSLATNAAVTIGWRLAVKTPIILADLAIGILLYWGLPGFKWHKLLFSSLWLLNPAAWYNSAVFGQFDAIATALVVASLVCFAKGRATLAFFLGILAGMTKQTALIPLAMMTAAYAGQNTWSKTFKYIAIMAGVAAAISLPFLFTGNIRIYFQTLFFSGQTPGYVDPVIYSFNGLGSLATYLHQLKGWDTSAYFWFILPVMMAGGLIALFFVYHRRIEILRAALIGIVLFVGLYYRVNYQYLVLMIALALMVAASTPYRSERIITLALAMLPSLWLWLFETFFWFYCLEPKYLWLGRIFSKLGLAHQGYPDYLYVMLALILNILCLVYAICTFTRWPKPLKPLFSK